MITSTTEARNRRFRRPVKLLAVLAAASLVAAACGSDDSSAPTTTAAGGDSTAAPTTTAVPAGEDLSARYGGTLVVGQAILTDTLDFRGATALQHEIVLDGIYESLLEVSTDLDFVPHLATEVTEVSPTEYVFKIRQGVFFHDGTPMTVDDVLFTFERILDADYTGPAKARLGLLDSVEVVDDETVRFLLKAPFASFLYHMASPETSGIHSRAFAAANNDDLSLIANGTGAFGLANFVPNELIELERHDQYWQEGLPYLDGVTINIITDTATRLAGLRTGEIHLTEISPTDIKELRAIPGVTLGGIYPSSGQVIFMNCQRAPLDDVRVRQALFLSIDEQLIMDVIYEEGMAFPTRFAPPIASPYGYTGDGSDLPFFGLDIDRAKALLAEAGYPDGVDLEIGFLNTGAFEVNRQMIELIRETAAPAGIRVNVFPMERGQMIEGLWDGWSTPLPGKPDPAAQERWLRPENALIRCPDDQLSELLNIQNTKTNPAERLVAWEAVEDFVSDNAIVHSTLSQPGRIRAWVDKVKDYVDVPHDRRMWLRQTWIDKS